MARSTFSGFQDKGLSIGEASDILLARCTIQNNNTGVAVKDLSRARCYQLILSNNKVAYNLYRKKQLFGGATLRNYMDVLEGNTENVKLDKESKAFPITQWESTWWADYQLVPGEFD